MVSKNAKKDPKNDPKRVRKVFSPSQAAEKYFTSTFLRVFHRPNFAQQIKSFSFTAGLCRGSHANKKKAHKHKLSVRWPLDRPRDCPRDKPGFCPYFTQWKPSLPQRQTQFVPGTIPGDEGRHKKSVLKVYVPFFRSL